jgi:hypothetical protein
MDYSFTQPIYLCIDYHQEIVALNPEDPYQHLPIGGRTASVMRLLLEDELTLLGGDRRFDVVIPAEGAEALWSAINVNVDLVLWAVPRMYNRDVDRMLDKGLIPEDNSWVEATTNTVAQRLAA